MKQQGVALFALSLVIVACATSKPNIIDRQNVLNSKIVKDFQELSQEDRQFLMPFLLDSVQHTMYGVGLSKTKEDLKKYGGLPGYFINHYPTYTSGALLFPVLRVYDYRGRLVDALVGGGIGKHNTLKNIGGFASPFDFSQVRIHDSMIDRAEAVILENVKNNKQNTKYTHNQQYYTPQLMSKIPDSKFVDTQKSQDINLGIGYDADCVDNLIRETQEETGIDINVNEVVLLALHNTANQFTNATHDTVVANGRAICSFMIEMGDVFLDKNGNVMSLKLNKKAIKNSDEIMRNFDIKTMTMKGGDDLEDGITFAKLSTLKKSDNTKTAKYTIQDFGTRKLLGFTATSLFPTATARIPLSKSYNLCSSLPMISLGTTGKVENNKFTSSATLVKDIKVKTLCD